MASAAGAVAEGLLRRRHLAAWPGNLYCYDSDEVRRATGRKLLLENPAGSLAIAAEYKAVEEGPLDLNDLQYQIVADATAEDLPAFVIQFTHPKLNPPQPWAFRLWPINDLARRTGAVEFTEQAYVQYLYVRQRGVTAGGGLDKSGQVWFECWQELAHLDGRWPDGKLWPPVVPLRPRSFRRVLVPNELVVRRYVELRGHLLDQGGPATVTSLDLNRPALGAFRPVVASPVKLSRSREDDDRYSRLRIQVESQYRKMWAAEPPSDDSREMWRCWQRDGSRRWKR